MYRRIIAALDNSPLSQQAFQQSLFLAQMFDAQLQLLNVISASEAEYRDQISLAGSGYYTDHLNETAQETWETEVEDKSDFLPSLAEKAANAGVSVEFIQEIGQPELQICKSAKDWEADLIVIGSHGRTGLNELLMGSVSNYVSHHVSCSVLIVH